MLDAAGTTFDEVRVWRDPACPACGEAAEAAVAAARPDAVAATAGR
jgi:hypothetical protein